MKIKVAVTQMSCSGNYEENIKKANKTGYDTKMFTNINVEKALEFALEYSDNIKSLEKSEKERGCLLVYQITNKGYYCIGWGFKDVPKGWSVYPFDFEIDIVTNSFDDLM